MLCPAFFLLAIPQPLVYNIIHFNQCYFNNLLRFRFRARKAFMALRVFLYAHLFPTRQTEMADRLDMERKGA